MWSGALDMNTDRNIVVTGFMGTGKSTVGKLLAEKLGRPFLDTDEEIVRRTGSTISEIFARGGEQEFRHLERRIARFLAAQQGYVISTGGGMLVDDGNRQVMEASGFVVCLNATPETLSIRLANDQEERPLLNSNWRALLERRQQAYAAISHQIDTDGKSPETIVDEIVGLWQTVTM
jgi:shikimate kinase